VAKHHKPVMLLFHPGGFVFGDAHMEDQAARVAGRKGFKPVEVNYALQDLPRALHDAKSAARWYRCSGRRVYAYGESTGGNLAARLAERGLARSAATYSAIPNFTRFAASIDTQAMLTGLHATLRTFRNASPAFHRSRRPILALMGRKEEAFMTKRPTWRWARCDPLVKARLVPGSHVGIDGPYGPNMRRAMRYLARQARK
jgi:acetyl esterase/lipase